MSRTEIAYIDGNGMLLSIATTDFCCPNCLHIDSILKYESKFKKLESAVITIKCKGCGEKLGLTTDMKSDAVCWIEGKEYVNNPTEEKVDLAEMFGDKWEEVKSILYNCNGEPNE